jgi:hypothetical protein
VATPSYLLSYLAIQAVRQGARFHERFPGVWLVWEPGSWQPPSRELVNTLGSNPGPKPTQPGQSDALCFQLTQPRVYVGRAPDNDCVVGDATVSRHHVELFERGGGWWVKVADGRQAGLDGAPFTGERQLFTGRKLQLGNVTMTFLDAAGLLARTGV